MARHLLAVGAFLLLLVLTVPAASPAPPPNADPLRLLSMNVGNAGDTCWESKLCVPSVVASLRSYIETYSPDIILLAEVMRTDQVLGTANGGPLLPLGYNVSCD